MLTHLPDHNPWMTVAFQALMKKFLPDPVTQNLFTYRKWDPCAKVFALFLVAQFAM